MKENAVKTYQTFALSDAVLVLLREVLGS